MNGMSIIWLCVMVGLGILEAITVQLVAIWFIPGAFLSFALSIFDMIPDITMQVVIFFVVSVVALIATRPLVKKWRNKQQPERTNLDRVVGEQGIVKQRIDNLLDEGRVHAIGLDWAARSVDGDQIEEGERVIIRRIDGVKLLVERADQTIDVAALQVKE